MDDFSDGNDEILKEFLIESHENLDQLDRDFIVLEQDPTDSERLGAIFRCIHTIKGTCGFFGFGKLESISHVGENLLSKIREGELTLTPEMTSALLQLVDAIRELLADIESTNAEGDGDYSAITATLTQLLEPGESPASEEAVEVEAVTETPEAEEVASDEDETSDGDQPKQLGTILVEEGKAEPNEVADALKKQLEGDERQLGTILVEDQGIQPEQVDEALNKQKEQKTPTNSGGLADSTIRVDVNLLDRLMNMVGELVLSRNQILQFGATAGDPAFLTVSQRLNLITSELQEGVMKTRMQPISAVWGKFPRVVRDLSNACGKNIAIEMEGKETELDKSILEAIKDPLTHVVRNSVDHGLESPEEREAAGKPAEGLLLLRAFHEGGQVIIEVVDDGAGINGPRVKAKAIEKGLITQQQADRMSQREMANLVFLPGFSTAAEVTNISGRGVGMDVVKTNIEKIGGTLDLQSVPGQGTTLRIKIPLTLAIIPALVITCAGSRYAIPQVNLLELVRIEGKEVEERIEMVHGSPVYRLRGNLLPLVYLDKTLGIESTPPKAVTDDGSEVEGDSDDNGPILNIVVLQAEDRQFGLIVETVHDTEEIVVKPLGKQLNSLSEFAGASIMGDGTVALILDVMGLAHTSGVISEGGHQRTRRDGDSQKSVQSSDKQTILVFRCGDSGRMAIPLDAVARLEEFSTDAVEHVGDLEVVQYREEILPLVRISKVFGDAGAQSIGDASSDSESDERPLEAVVYRENGRSVGLVVEKILDITETSLANKGHSSREGVEFTAVVHEKVAEFVDVRHVIRSVIPDFFEERVLKSAQA